MSNEWAPAAPPKPRRRWPRRLGWVAGGLFILLVALYFFLTSFTFLEVFVLPRASQALNAKITLEDASISPFSKVSLRGLKVQTSVVGEPLLTAREVRARYSLFDIIGGHINVTEVTLDSPVINLVEDENGGTNLDPLLKSSKEEKKPAPPAPAQQPSKPPQIKIQSVMLTNVTVRRQKLHKDGGREVAEVSNVNLTLSGLANGQAGRLGLGAEIKFDKTPPPSATNTAHELIEAKLSAAFEFALTADLKPQSIRGKAALDLAKAPASFPELAGLGLTLETDVTPSEIKQLSIAFAQSGAVLGQITASGPLDLAKQEGQVKLEISSIDRRVLNLAGAALGIDFGPTTLNASHEIVLAKGGQSVTAKGRFGIHQLSLTQKGLTTKPLDFQLDYDVALDQAEKSALVSGFTLTGTQNQAPLLRGALARPMKLSFGNTSNAVEESAFDLVLTNFNLADWRAFIGDYAGTASLTLNLLAKQAGKNLKVDLTSRIDGLAGAVGSNRIDQATVAVALHTQIEDFDRVQLNECAVELQRQNQTAITFRTTGRYSVKSQEAGLQTAVEAFIPVIAGLLANPEFKSPGGKLSLNAQIAQKNLTPNATNQPTLLQGVSGSVRLENLAANYGPYQFNRLEAGINFDLGLSNQVAEIRKFAGTLQQAGQSGGSFDVSGRYHLTNQTGEVAFKLNDLNQNLLRSFASPSLGDKQLASISINLNLAANYAASGESRATTELQIANLLILDPKGQLPKVPLTVAVKLEAGLRSGLAAIRQFTGDVRQGELAGGHFEVSGQYDLNKKIGQAAFKLADLNQNAMRPLLASALGDKTLQSISINIDTTASYDALGESSVNGNFQLRNLLLTDPKNQLPKVPLTADLKVNAGLRNDQADIREFAAKLKLGDLPGGALAVSGKYDLKRQTGKGAFKLEDLNQNALAPFLGSALGDKKLTSISINADTEASYDPNGPAALKGKIEVKNLLISDPAGKLPVTPLGVALTVNGAWMKQLLNLDQFQIALSPTERARNELSLTGKVDLAVSNAISGDLKLAAESLDLTPYFDMFSGPQRAPATTNAAAFKPSPAPGKPAPTTPAPPPAEPPAMTLPLRNFAFDLNIGRLYLREIAITNWQTVAKINGAAVSLKPVQLAINGAPVSAVADVNLGVPGFQYDVTLSADKIPLEPLANTFMPESRGQYKGSLIASARIKGAGITGVNLQKNLDGEFAFSFTNASLQIATPRLKAFFVPIGLLLGAPDLINSPLNWAGASAKLGGGKIQLTRFNLVSDSFTADTQGDIKITDILMDSPLEKWPMHFYLRRSMADRLRLTPSNTPADAAYAKLPDFIKVAGTLGSPKPELNALALSGSVLEKVAEKTGLKQKVGSLLDLLPKSK